MDQITTFAEAGSSVAVSGSACPSPAGCRRCKCATRVKDEDGDRLGCSRIGKTNSIPFVAWLRQEGRRLEAEGYTTQIVEQEDSSGAKTGRIALFAQLADEEPQQ